jgi:hypothetical protein
MCMLQIDTDSRDKVISVHVGVAHTFKDDVTFLVQPFRFLSLLLQALGGVCYDSEIFSLQLKIADVDHSSHVLSTWSIFRYSFKINSLIRRFHLTDTELFRFLLLSFDLFLPAIYNIVCICWRRLLGSTVSRAQDK